MSMYAQIFNRIGLLLFLVSISFNILGQGFEGKAFGGVSLSQLEGDFLSGFDKFGIHTGVQVAFPLREKIALGMEIAYTQRGSRAGLLSLDTAINKTTLQYIELPVFFEVRDWYIDDGDYFKIAGHGGLALSYLISVDSDHVLFADDIEAFNKNDFSFFCGATFALSPKLAITARYQRGFSQIYKSDKLLTGGLISYLWIIRTDYKF